MNKAITYDGAFAGFGSLLLANQGSGQAAMSIQSDVALQFGIFDIGGSGRATVAQAAGSLSGWNINLAAQTTGVATYQISGGSLNIDTVRLGENGSGVLDQSGGVVKITSSLYLGFGSGMGTYLLS